MNEACILCKEPAKAQEYPEKSGYIFYSCPNCGQYIIATNPDEFSGVNRSKLVSFLFYHSFVYKTYRIYFIGELSAYNFLFKENQNIAFLSNEEIENWYPNTFNEKIDEILLALAEITVSRQRIGLPIGLNITSTYLLFFSEFFKGIERRDRYSQGDQFYSICNYLVNQKYLEYKFEDIYKFMITPEGWIRIDELQKKQSRNKDIFVAMSFSDQVKPIREAIRDGIIKAGFSPTIMDEIIHNEQIVPAMLRMIRQSRILILEITEPNYGAYYEAGYALGLGKEVIICCKNEIYNKEYNTEEEKKYEKYLKPHFDIAQKQILVWNDYDDLTHKLSEWIKALSS